MSRNGGNLKKFRKCSINITNSYSKPNKCFVVWEFNCGWLGLSRTVFKIPTLWDIFIINKQNVQQLLCARAAKLQF